MTMYICPRGSPCQRHAWEPQTHARLNLGRYRTVSSQRTPVAALSRESECRVMTLGILRPLRRMQCKSSCKLTHTHTALSHTHRRSQYNTCVRSTPASRASACAAPASTACRRAAWARAPRAIARRTASQPQSAPLRRPTPHPPCPLP